MDSAEIDSLVGELESRVDRLRALYDQYFMGIERLEPLVPKKDVERRLTILRKEQIRNTGTRYRFQMIVQRYNTFLTYWQRISRQIEQGTYKRDVMRAQARFGVNPAKERTVAPPALEPNGKAAAAPPVEIPDGPIVEAYELEALPEELEFLETDLLDDKPSRARPAPPPERFVSGAKLELDEFSDPFEEHDPFPKPPKPSAPKIRLAPGRAAPEESRDTERRIPAAASAARPAPAPPPSAPSLKPQPRVVVAKRASMPDPLEAVPAPQPPPPSTRTVSPAMASAPRVQPRGAPTLPQPTPPAQVARAAALPQKLPNIAAPPPPPRPTTSPQARPAAPAPAPQSPVGDLTRDRFGQIYSQYVETRRKQNEPTGAITRDALAKQLDESTARLKQKHVGKAIDFEVVVKDGRTILRPVVK